MSDIEPIDAAESEDLTAELSDEALDRTGGEYFGCIACGCFGKGPSGGAAGR